MDVPALEKTLDAKLKVIELVRKSSEKVLKDGNVRECERKLTLVETKLTELNELKTQIQEAKIVNDVDETEVETWGTEIDEKLAVFIAASIELQNFINGENQKETTAKHEEELKRKSELETKPPTPTIIRTGVPGEHFNAKLPKLQIASFEGIITDWNRFWNTFTKEVDKKTTIPQTTKFSYLKEKLSLKKT